MTEEEHVLFIDSRFSDTSSNVDFSVIFNRSLNTHSSGYPTQVFKNVKKVELSAFSINKNVLELYPQETYVVLDIEELNNRVHSNVPEVNQSFAIIYIDKELQNTNNEWVNKPLEVSLKGPDFDVKIKKFNPPLSSLSRLTIKIKNPYTRETVPDLGKTTFIFKITTVQSSA